MTESQGRAWILTFPVAPPGPNARLHWSERAQSARDFKTGTMLRVRQQEIPKLQKIRISAVFYRKRLFTADEDNDIARLKPIVDGIVASGVAPSDTRRFVEWGPVLEHRSPEPRLVVKIEEVVE